MSFKAQFAEFRKRSSLFKFVTHPHECTVNEVDLSYIPNVCVNNFKVKVADLKALDVWVSKFKSMNKNLETLAREQAALLPDINLLKYLDCLPKVSRK